ncbi:LysR family transcriptional regulator [Roseomonas aerophila]|uniref:LysR family transcriptional regulator n=1 Tax=Teichococcus aerophilus TaxID=1224513 RepID=A0ABR7RHQ6_9PROT|nr:LysR substrate-binding domain-containing protein [Pseudoroseomonas aerophila]MBC9206089.1 LysR family transcriptional regulator [Pseudoroseomonas aerophila]
MHPPDLRSLTLFLSVFELRNVTKAAARHHTVPSSVTKRIQDLEQQYGVTLFERRARGVLPTDAAEHLARHAREVLLALDRSAAAMSEFAQGARGQVHVAASASILMGRLASRIASFIAAHPAIRLSLAEEMTHAGLSAVLDGRADLAFISGAAEVPPGLQATPYPGDRLMVLVPPGHALWGRSQVGFAETLDFPHLGIGTMSSVSLQLGRQAEALGRAIDTRLRVSTADVARQLVAHGLGIAILPDGMTQPFEAVLGIRGIPLSDPWAERQARICYREAAGLTVAARLFLAHATQPAAAP